MDIDKRDLKADGIDLGYFASLCDNAAYRIKLYASSEELTKEEAYLVGILDNMRDECES